MIVNQKGVLSHHKRFEIYEFNVIQLELSQEKKWVNTLMGINSWNFLTQS